METTKTYADTFKKEPFNWNEFLNKTEITEREWEDAFFLANSWVTCACGNQCSIIQRNYEGAPRDKTLRILGMKFGSAIEMKDVLSAKDILHLIEQRSTELIAEIKSQS